MNFVRLIEWFAEQTNSDRRWSLAISLPHVNVVDFYIRLAGIDIVDRPLMVSKKFSLLEVGEMKEDFIRLQLEEAIQSIKSQSNGV